MSAPIRVVLVDDQELVRTGLRAILTKDGDIEVVGEASDGAAGVSRVRACVPEVVVMDLRMPLLDGIAATSRIRTDPDLQGVHVLVLTTFDTDDEVVEAIRAGASGYVLKDAAPSELRDSVRGIAAGNAVLSPGVHRAVMRAAARKGPAVDLDLVERLTERELEILSGVGRGLTNDEIAGELFISPATARTYVSRLMTKLEARDRVALVLVAHRAGLADPDTHPTTEGRS